ncbi:MAG: hypothetical protein ACOY90_06480 [Candidatus Zhuqueibacterota bacterium]
MKRFFFRIFFLIASISQIVAVEFFVATTGSDSNPGTKEKPFAATEFTTASKSA